MVNNTAHIISRLSWDTLFDSRNTAFELQERISNWSRIQLPGALTEILNEMCPPDQTWRINMLQLNMGVLELENFENDMMLKLRKQLKEQLSNLILYPGQQGNIIEVQHGAKSLLQLVESYLINGYMPWSYKGDEGTLNEILAELLKENLSRTVARLRKIGISSLNVRKRMAWQLSEDNIVLIIKGLEPGNHREIKSFTDEMVTLQEKTPVVQASAKEFKKQLWLWVLNYLLAERGTVFNRIAFAKSSLTQMAAGYNIAYAELLGLIEQAVKVVAARHTGVKPEFIKTLQVLISEKPALKTNKKDRAEKGYLETLETYFKNPELVNSPQKAKEFNALFTALLRQGDKKLAQMILTGLKSKAVHTMLAKTLLPDSFEMLIRLQQKTHGTPPMATVKAVEAILNDLGVSFSRKEIMLLAFDCMATNKMLFSGRVFLNSLLQKLLQGSNRETFLKNIGTAAISAEKSAILLEIYNLLPPLLKANAVAPHQDILAAQLSGAATLLENIRNKSVAGSIISAVYKDSIAQNCAWFPKAMLAALQEHGNKQELLQWIPYFIDNDSAKKLLAQAPKEALAIIAAIKKALAKTDAVLTAAISEAIESIALEALAQYKKHDEKALLQFIAGRIYSLCSHEKEYFALFISFLKQEKDISNYIDTAFPFLKYSAGLPLLKEAKKLMVTTQEPKQLAGLLLDRFNDAAFTEARISRNAAYKQLLHYLLKQDAKTAELLYNRQVLEIKQRFPNLSVTSVNATLTAVFWKCVLQNILQNGSIQHLEKKFVKAVQHIYPAKAVRQQQPLLAAINTNAVIYTDNGNSIAVPEIVSLLEKALRLGKLTVKNGEKEIKTVQLLQLALDYSPTVTIEIIGKLTWTEKRLSNLMAITTFESFVQHLISGAVGSTQSSIALFYKLYNYLLPILQQSGSDKAQQLFWKEIITVIKNRNYTKQKLDIFIYKVLENIEKETNINISELSEQVQFSTPQLNNSVINALKKYLPHLNTINDQGSTEIKIEGIIRKAKRRGILYDLVQQLVIYRQLPPWPGTANEKEKTNLLLHIVQHETVVFLSVLKREIITENQMQWLNTKLNFSVLVKAASGLNKNMEPALKLILSLYYSFGSMALKGITAAELQFLLFSKFIKAWTSGNWKALSAGQIWNEILWDCSVKKGLRPAILVKQLGSNPAGLPPALLASLRQVEQHYMPAAAIAPIILPSDKNKKNMAKITALKTPQKEMVHVKNAGMVLINNYIQMLLERLELVKDKRFTSDEKRDAAAHYLQYVATGLQNTEEHFLPLNKVLCGIPLEEAITTTIEVTDEEKALINGLLETVINYWGAIGKTSVQGLRGNWLVRDGLLMETEERWELTVEKKPYDILLNRSPFSFSIIKYPWMPKPLHVNWNY